MVRLSTELCASGFAARKKTFVFGSQSCSIRDGLRSQLTLFNILQKNDLVGHTQRHQCRMCSALPLLYPRTQLSVAATIAQPARTRCLRAGIGRNNGVLWRVSRLSAQGGAREPILKHQYQVRTS